DQIVWAEVIRLLEEPALIQQELDRRLVAARTSDPTRKHEQSLQRELTHVGKGIERPLNAYQEGLLSIEQLRERMPMLRQRQQALRAELQAIADQTNDRAAFLRLAETLTAFLARLRSAAETLNVMERQRIVRLLVKDVLVGEHTITIRHSIPIPLGSPQNGGSQSPEGPNYLLRTGRERTPLGSPFHAGANQPALHHPGIQKCPDEFSQPLILDPLGDLTHQFVVIDSIKKFSQVEINHPAVTFGNILLRLCHRLMGRASRSKTVAVFGERRVPLSLQNLQHCLLYESVQRSRNAELAHSASVRLGDFHPPHRFRCVVPA